MTGDYGKLFLQVLDPATVSPDLAEAIAWGHIAKALDVLAQARAMSDPQADRLFRSAYQEFEAALKIKPHMHEALYNWGTTLAAWAKTKSGVEADGLFELAGAKYEAALAIKPDKQDRKSTRLNSSHHG